MRGYSLRSLFVPFFFNLTRLARNSTPPPNHHHPHRPQHAQVCTPFAFLILACDAPSPRLPPSLLVLRVEHTHSLCVDSSRAARVCCFLIGRHLNARAAGWWRRPHTCVGLCPVCLPPRGSGAPSFFSPCRRETAAKCLPFSDGACSAL